MNTTPTAGYGYILIDTPEKKAKFAPKIPGDQWLYMGHWRIVADRGDFDTCETIYRRKIEAGEGWEIVPPGTMPKNGDEFTRDGITWEGGWNYDEIPVDHDLRCSFAFRRKPTAPAFKFEVGQKVVALCGIPCEILARFNHPLYEGNAYVIYVHGISSVWREYMLSPIPQKSDAEKAWERECRRVPANQAASIKESFIFGYTAGFNAGKQAK